MVGTLVAVMKTSYPYVTLAILVPAHGKDFQDWWGGSRSGQTMSYHGKSAADASWYVLFVRVTGGGGRGGNRSHVHSLQISHYQLEGRSVTEGKHMIHHKARLSIRLTPSTLPSLTCLLSYVIEVEAELERDGKTMQRK